MDYKQRMEKWLFSSKVSESDKQTIIDAPESIKEDMFAKDLEFGTGGIRALLGPGSNRLNVFTVKRATIGVCNFLSKKYKNSDKKLSVAISFDNRHGSIEFRDVAAKIFTDYGFDVFTFNKPHPTPELSYTVRHLNCVAGVMITASHNPKEYNGYKLYDEDGCQAVYKNVEDVIAEINNLINEIDVSYEVDSYVTKGSVHFLDSNEDYDNEFIDKELTTSLYKEYFNGERLTKIIFTPQCGCNCKLGPKILREAGYQVLTVPTQDDFDPDFKGTENPNPETYEAYKKAIALLNEKNEEGEKYNLILCTDPDADRCGLAFINSKGDIQRLTGNQTGALLIDFVLSTRKRRNELPHNGCICNTFVTSGQGAKVAKMYNIPTRTTATGFKYIGNMINRMKDDHQEYLFGYEESYGYLLADYIRDKDSLQSILAIADMNEYYLRQGKTLDQAMKDLDRKTGHYFDTQVNIFFSGAAGQRNMLEGIKKIRSNPPFELGGLKVEQVSDYLDRKTLDGQTHRVTEMNLPDVDKTNCLRFDFEGGSFLAIRPSGTEPKVKFYIEIINDDDSKASKIADKISKQLKKIMGLE